MANNRREVDLIVRTQDELTRVFNLINKVLDVFSENADEVGAKAEKAGSGVTGLGKAFADLGRALKGQTAITTATANLDKATAAMGKLQERSQKLEAGLNDVRQKFGEAGVQAAQYAQKQGQLDQRLKTQTATLEQQKAALTASKEALTAVTTVQREYDGAVTTTSGKIGTLQKNLDLTIQKYEKQAAAIDATDKPYQRQINSLAATQTRLEKYYAALAQANVELEKQKTNAAIAAEVTNAYKAQVESTQKVFDAEKIAIGQTNEALRQNAREITSNSKLQSELAEDVNLTTQAFERNAAEVTRSAEQLGKIEAEYREIGAATESLAEKTRGELVQALRLQQSTVDQLRNRHEALRASLAEVAAELNRTKVPTRDVQEAYRALTDALQETKAAVSEQQAVYQRLKQTLATLPPELAASEAAVREFIAAIDSGADELSRIDKEVKDANASFTKFEENQRRAAPATKETTSAIKEEANALKSIFDNTQRLGSARGGIDELSAAYRSLYGETRQALSYTQRLRSEVLALISTYGGFFTIIQVLTKTVEATQKVEAAQVRLRSVFGDNTKAGEEFDFVRREANRLGIDIGVLADEYTKFAAATQGTNLAGAETRRIFLAVAEAGKVQHLSIEDLGGIFKALQQIVSKGHVQLEELSGQLGDRLPGALQIMADGLGITVNDLLALTKQGKLSSDALSAFADNLEKRYGKDLPDALKTTSSEIGRFQNAATQALLAFGQGGFIEGFNSLLQSIEKTLSDPQFLDFLKSISSLLGAMEKALGLVIENWKLLTAAIGAFVAVRLVGVLTSVVGALADVTIGAGAATKAIQAMTVAEREFATARAAADFEGFAGAATKASGAVRLLRNGLRFLFSGPGIAVAGLGLLVKGFYDIATTAPDATAALADAQKVLDQVGVALDHAGQNIEQYRKSLQGLTADTVKNSITQLESVKSFQQVDLLQRLEQIQAAASDPRTMAGATDARAAQQLAILKIAFDNGKISLDEYVESLEKVRKENSDANFDIAGFTKSMETQAEAGDVLNKEIQRLKDIYTVLTSSGAEAQAAFDRLNGLTDEGDASIKRITDDTNKYNEELNKLNNIVPDVNQGLKEMKELAKLDDAFASATKYVRTIGQLLGLIKDYNIEKQKIFDQQANSDFRGYTNSLDITRKLIQDKEAFRDTPYKDNDGKLRIGYGSDTYQGADGIVRQVVEGVKISVSDANRDLDRRIGEFVKGITDKIGTDTFSKLNPAQQAALTDIAYNYGSLPDRIAKVIKAGGSTDEIAQAIRGLKDDNGGINENRRLYEASLYQSQAGTDIEEAQYKKATDDAERLAETQKKQGEEFHRTQQESLTALQDENAALGQTLVQREVAKALAQQQAAADKAHTTVTQKEKDDLVKLTTEKYKQASLDEQQKKLEEAVNQALEKRNQLVELRNTKLAAGDTAGANSLNGQIQQANVDLQKATDSATAFLKTLSGEKADAAVAKMATINEQAKNFSVTGNDAKAIWSGLGQSIFDNLANAFDTFAQAVANGENAWKALATAVRTAAAQILIDLGNMIIKATLFRLLSGFFPGLSSGIPGITAHDGTGSGAIGAKTPSRSRSLSPLVVATAPRFHSGYDGLAPNEIPAVLEKTEAVLTKEDPFHPRNRAKMFAGMGKLFNQQVSLTNINLVDPADIVEAGLSTPRGDKVLINRIGKNKESVKKTVNG